MAGVGVVVGVVVLVCARLAPGWVVLPQGCDQKAIVNPQPSPPTQPGKLAAPVAVAAVEAHLVGFISQAVLSGGGEVFRFLWWHCS